MKIYHFDEYPPRSKTFKTYIHHLHHKVYRAYAHIGVQYFKISEDGNKSHAEFCAKMFSKAIEKHNINLYESKRTHPKRNKKVTTKSKR